MKPRYPENDRAFLLNAALGWRGGRTLGDNPLPAPGIATGDRLRLAANAQGALALTSADGSLGRLTLPRGMALDADLTVHLLVSRAENGGSVTAIRRFNAHTERFEDLPEVGGKVSGDEIPEVRGFRPASAIAILGKALYVADPESGRVQVFDLTTLVLRHVWDQHSRGEKARWQPVDVAASAHCIYMLDRAHGRVYRHRPGSDPLERIDFSDTHRGAWTRIAVDRDERLYLYNAQTGKLEVFAFQDAWGLIGTADDAGDVRGNFDPPAVIVEQSSFDKQLSWFCLPSSLRRNVGRQLPNVETPTVSAACESPEEETPCFAFSTGEPLKLKPEERIGLPLYRRCGVWVSSALDSEIYRCQWHRLQLEIECLPLGSQIEVFTYTSADKQDDALISQIPEESWQRSFALIGTESNEYSLEGLVQSREGQYLWLRLCLTGDGFETPEIGSIRVQFPRDSYLKYLPAVFSQDEESRWFLERYLSIAQTEWENIERNIRESARYFDPKAVPGGVYLKYLASWYAVPLEGEWTDDQNRRLLTGAQRIYGQRGTLSGLRAWLRVYLHNLSGVSDDDQERLCVPVLLESYRARMLSRIDAPDHDAQQAGMRLGEASPLWSDQVVNRFQLDVNSVEGEAQIISMGDPQMDPLTQFAHRFEVYVPAAWIRSAADERMLRRALDTEKPAHTSYDLHLVEPRFRVGVQAMIGVDAIIGALPTPQPLGAEPGPDSDAPPSQAGRGRLGYDSVLDQGNPAIQRHALGRDTRLF